MTPQIFFVHLRELYGKTMAPAHYIGNIDFSKSGFDCRPFCEVVKIDPTEPGIVTPPYHLVPMEAVSAEYGSIERIDEIGEGNMGGYSRFRNGDVICARISPCMENGKMAVVSTSVKGVIFGSTEFYVFRPDSRKLLPGFLHFLLRMERLRQTAGQHLSGTTGHQRVTRDFFCRLTIPVPPLDVQRRIVAELDAAYAAKRAADEKATKLLASIDDVVLSELGISKLPQQDTSIRARMFMVAASEVFENRMDAVAYQDLRRQFLKNVAHSRYSSIPLGALVDVNRQQTDVLNGRQYVGLENIDGTIGDFLPTQDKESLSSAVLFNEGEILFPKLRPYLNKVWLATFDGAASTEFYPLQSKTEDAAYLTAYLRTKVVVDVMTLLMTGNTLPRVQLEDILSLPVPVPPRSIQRRIVEKTTAIREEAKRLRSDAAEALSAAKSSMEAQILGE